MMTSVRRLFDPTTAREVIAVSAPLMFGMVGNLVLMLVDRISLARYSPETLAASGPAIFTATTVIMVTTGAVGITRSYVAQARGRGDNNDALEEGALGVVFAVLLSLVLLAITPLLIRVPEFSTQPETIKNLESQFLGLSTFYGAVMTTNMALSSYFNGMGRTRVPLVVGLVGQAVGLVMIFGLVFGHFGLPELGMRGSALGTLFAVAVMFVGYCIALPQGFVGVLGRVLGSGMARLGSSLWLRVRRGAPAGGSLGLEELGQTSFVWIIGLFGASALAANNVALSLNYAAVIPLIGLGLGCNILCGNAIGAQQFARVGHIMRVTIAVCGCYVVVIAFFQIATPTLMLAPFGLAEAGQEDFSIAIDTSRVLWTYAAAFMFSMVASSVLESFGLARFGFAVRIVLMWCLCIPIIVTIAATHREQAHLVPAMWLIFSFFEALMAGVCLWRIKKAIARSENQLLGGRNSAPPPTMSHPAGWADPTTTKKGATRT